MKRMLVSWLLNTLSILVVAHLVPGIRVAGILSALIASLVIGFVNATLGVFLKVLTLPLTLVTFGLFLLVINAAMLKFSSLLVPGFYVQGFWAAFIGAIVLSLLNMLLRYVVGRR
ncbi:MAG: phage holin family protein [Acidobacteriota bacterium]